MKKRIVIAGSRNYQNYDEAKEYIDRCISRIKEEYELIFLSGGCRGADSIGERYAVEKGYKIERYLPQWDKYGRSAGPKRNEIMAELCDYVICFWDGKSSGTKSMIKFAHQRKKQIRIKYIEI